MRNAQAEKAKNKPPRAYREIFQVLRTLLLPAALGLEGVNASSDDDLDDAVDTDTDGDENAED